MSKKEVKRYTIGTLNAHRGRTDTSSGWVVSTPGDFKGKEVSVCTTVSRVQQSHVDLQSLNRRLRGRVEHYVPSGSNEADDVTAGRKR